MCFLLANFIVACRDGGNGRAAPGPFATSLFVPFAFNMDQAQATLDGGGYLNSGDYLWEKISPTHPARRIFEEVASHDRGLSNEKHVLCLLLHSGLVAVRNLSVRSLCNKLFALYSLVL